MSASTWHQRNEVGRALEDEVTQQLRARRWRTAPWGLGTLPPVMRAMIKAAKTPISYLPDLVISREDDPSDIALIDCKAQLPGGNYVHNVDEQCLYAHLALVGVWRVPLYYVFSDFAVVTAQDALAVSVPMAGTVKSSGKPYVRIRKSRDRRFDDVFGSLPMRQPRALYVADVLKAA